MAMNAGFGLAKKASSSAIAFQCILKGNFKDTKHRKLTELLYIVNFDTNKLGFNKFISFLRRYDTFKH